MSAFNLQPRLAGPVLLRPLAATDWTALFAVASDPLIWADHPASDRWQESIFRSFFDAALDSGGALAIIDPASAAIIGSSRFDARRVRAGDIEIGWTFLARAHWGGTTNPVIKAMMIAHALSHYERVLFFVGAGNIRSRRAMAKIGGVLIRHEPVEAVGGTAVPQVVFAIDRSGFANGPLRSLVPA